MLGRFLGTLVLGASSSFAAELPRFEPRVLPDHTYDGGWEHFVGGGVATFDCNGDRFPDMFLAGGANPAQLMVNITGAPGAALSFQTTDGLKTPELTGVTGAYPVDIDADGLLDLAVMRVGPDVLLKGDGTCQFRPFESALNFQSSDRWTTAFSATWEDGQSLPTLAFGTYVDRANPNGPFETCDATLLYRPDGTGYQAAQELTPGFCALSMLFTDWNRSGRQDLRISNDRHYYVRGGQEQLWDMQNPPRLYGAEDGWHDYQLWGMGIASRDMNGDGFSDVFLTSMGDQVFQMRDAQSGQPSYVSAPFEKGTSAHRPHVGGDGRPSTGWHAAFGDVQNDGLDDIFVAKGNVDQMPDAALEDPNNLLVQNKEGRFFEAGDAAGLASLHRGRGAALVDLNLDGRLDVVVVNRRAKAELFENQSDVGNWLNVDLQVAGPNHFGVGYFIEVRSDKATHVREVTVGGGHAGGHAGMHHFGLGDVDRVEIRVIRPDQSMSDWVSVPLNQSVTVQDTGNTVTLN